MQVSKFQNLFVLIVNSILSAPGAKQVDAMVATKLLRDPPKCTAPKPITQDFTKLRKSTFTFATSVSHWCTFKHSYQPDLSKVRSQSFNRWSKLMVKTRQSTYSDNQWFRLVFFNCIHLN